MPSGSERRPAPLRRNRVARCSALLFALAALPPAAVATPGDLDRTFANGQGRVATALGADNEGASAVALQSDGKILLSAYTLTDNGTPLDASDDHFDFALVRYSTDGTLDTTFGGNGFVTTPIGPGDDLANAIAVQSDGKILLAGYTWNGSNYDIALLRYNTDGSLDPSFDGDGIVTQDPGAGNEYAFAVALQTDGKILVSGLVGGFGPSGDLALLRFNTDGSLDATFDGDTGTADGIVTTNVGTAGDYGYALAIQGDGKILQGGYSYVSGVADFALVRYNSDGTLDTTFDADGKVITAVSSGNEEAYGIAIQPDGKILLAGAAAFSGNWDFAVVRYNGADGSLDTSFDTDGIRSIAPTAGMDYGYGVAVQTDEKIVLTGYSSLSGNAAVVRLNADGSLDSGFDGDTDSGDGVVFTDVAGNDDRVFGALLQSDGKILVPGYASNGENYDVALIRYSINYDPTFSSTPGTAVDEDTLYSYAVVAADVEAGPLLITASELPDWLTLQDHGDGTATLAATPTNDDVGDHAVTLQVDDGADTVEQTFTISVSNVNDAPTDVLVTATAITETDTVTTVPVTVGTLTADDVDVGDSHVFAIVTDPEYPDADNFELDGVVLRLKAGVLLDRETKPAFTLQVVTTDASSASYTKTLTIDVSDVNEPPNPLSAIQPQAIDINGSGQLALTVFDIDNTLNDDKLAGLELSLVAQNEDLIPPQGVVFEGAGDQFTVTITPGYLQYGTTTVTLTLSDGEFSESTSFEVTVWGVDTDDDGIPDLADADDDNDGMSDVFELGYGLDILDANDAAADSDGDGATNLEEYFAETNPLVDDYPPVVMPPPDVTVSAVGLFTEVELGEGSALDAVDGALPAAPEDVRRFEPGSHRVTWVAIDAAGNRGTAEQTVNVLPLVSFMPDQQTGEGSSVAVRVVLNGDAPAYPVTVPYTVGGTAANPADHDLTAGSVTISAGREGILAFSVTADTIAEAVPESVVITMGAPTGAVAGNRATHTVSIVDGNLAPRVSLDVRQAERSTRLLMASDDPVTVSATIVDPNPGDVHTYDWSDTDNGLASNIESASSFTLSPRELAPGYYRIALTVADSGLPAKIATVSAVVQVLASAPELITTEDEDGDGLTDAEEGYGDGDGDGIADYQDALNGGNVVQARQGTIEDYLLETTPGLTLRIGAAAFEAGGVGSRVSAQEIEAHTGRAPDSAVNVGGYFDFEIGGLSQAGDSAQIVIPQDAAVPAYPVYRKLGPRAWVDFTVNERNSLASAAGEAGYCPPPGDAQYQPGLTPGHWCVLLTIEDGGPNDADGLANGVIADPGGVANREPVPDSGGGGSLGMSLAGLLFAARRRRR